MKNDLLETSLKVIAFDADDTLWDCQSHFEAVERRLYELLAPWCDATEAARALFATERGNMATLGYGSKAFTLSVVETALSASHQEIAQPALAELVTRGKSLLSMPATPLPGVTDTLGQLRRQWRSAGSGRRMVAFTKGELQEQENKFHRSGLEPLFDHIEIVSNKGEAECRALCEKLRVRPDELLMVGNSFKSDIAPALSIGAWAAYVPFHVVWQLEHSEEYDHERLFRMTSFSDLLKIVWPNPSA